MKLQVGFQVENHLWNFLLKSQKFERIFNSTRRSAGDEMFRFGPISAENAFILIYTPLEETFGSYGKM